MSKNKEKSFGLWSLLPYFLPYRKKVILAFVALFTTAIMVLFFGKAIKYLIDYGFNRVDPHLNLMIIIFVLAVFVLAVAGYYRSFLINSVAENVINDMKQKLYAHILTFSPDFFTNAKTGDIISRLTVDTIIIYNIISNTVSFFLRNLVLFLGGLLFLFLTNTKLSLVAFLVILLAVLPIIFIAAHIEESLNGIQTIQAYLCENREIANFNQHSNNAVNSSLNKIHLKALLVALVIAISFGAVSVIILVGGHDVLSGKITAGELLSFLFYAVLMATSLVGLSQIFSQIQTASGSLMRIGELLAIKPNFPTTQNNGNEHNIAISTPIDINFSQVGFHYLEKTQQNILTDFNLNINYGEKIGIVGLSGSGKSTILQLLLRFQQVTSGQILLNNHNINDLPLALLREQFAYISQNCFIFSGSVFENISYVNKNITKQQVLSLVENTPALHFILDFKDGIDTLVGEKGVKISGGERQRIALARAIIKDSPILLLDEITSALDNQNQKLVMQSINQLANHKTVITVAHRLSFLSNCQKIAFIHQGKIVEYGEHQELLALNGFYRKMFDADINFN
ncbi:MAG: ATP-binding cassette domain-containing protein [Proteobacteria bacterium]|nr:ATP-binding cassette domain-containing protein [Pseudomonadota bacterium]